MPLSVLVGAFVGAVATKAAEYLFSKLCSSDKKQDVLKILQENTKSVKVIDLKKINPSLMDQNNSGSSPNIIEHPAFVKNLVSSIADKDGGLWVLGAPAGCGKSTYLQCAIDNFRQENKDRHVFILMGIKNFQDHGIHKALSIPDNSDLSTYLPEGTVIIIDQIDSKVDRIDATMEDYIIKLAAESRNKRVFSLLVSVNDSSVMLKILHMNQGEKIKDVCKPECIQWTQAQANKFIKNAFKELSPSEKNKVLSASNIDNEYFVPGMIWTASKDYHSGHKIDTVLENMKSIQISKKEEWGKYGENLKNYRFNRTKIE